MATSTNISNFELLVKPIIDSPSSPNRTVIQGYFLTISNPNFVNLTLKLTFTALSPDLNSSPLAAFWDANDTNAPLTPTNSGFGRSYTFELGFFDTGLFLLQPDVTIPEVIADQDTEIRGYVRLEIESAFSPFFIPGDVTLMLSAQQRGTFLPQGDIEPPAMGDFDQLAYSLPIASGGSEVTLEPLSASGGSIPDIGVIQGPLFEAIAVNPTVLRGISGEPLAQQLAELTVPEQRRVLSVLLNRQQRSTASPNRPEPLPAEAASDSAGNGQSAPAEASVSNA